MPPRTPAPASAASASPRAGGAVALLSWAHFLNDGAANFLPGILPVLLAAMAIPIGYAGAIMAILIAGQALQPLTGLLSDTWGGRAFLVAGLAGSSLGAAWVGWAHGRASLIAALVLIGVCNAGFHPPALAATRAYGGGSGERQVAVFLVGGEIGRGAWPLAASVVVEALGLGGLWVLALAAAVTLPGLWLRLRDIPRRPPPGGAWRALREARGPLAALLAYSSLRSAMIVGVSAFVPLWWEARGGRLVTGAALITTMLVVGIVGNFGAAVLAERLGRRAVVAAGTLLSCVFLALFLCASGAWLWLLMAALGVALFATLPLTVLMGQDLLPRHHALGSGLALGFCNALGAAVVAALGGALAARWGAAGVLWAMEGCGLAALALAATLPRLTDADAGGLC
ncbi:MAG: MFS transporter [Terriglobales bacterium]